MLEILSRRESCCLALAAVLYSFYAIGLRVLTFWRVKTVGKMTPTDWAQQLAYLQNRVAP